MTNLTRDQGILQAIAALCRDLDNNKMPSYLCNDWSSEASMRSCECHAGSPMATREPCQASSRSAPRGPVRVDAAVSTYSSASVRGEAQPVSEVWCWLLSRTTWWQQHGL